MYMLLTCVQFLRSIEDCGAAFGRIGRIVISGNGLEPQVIELRRERSGHGTRSAASRR